MSFMSRFKKKPAPSKAPPQPISPQPINPQPEPLASPVKKEDITDLPSPTHPVEIDSSIFSGLKLSAQVASKEDDGSPYLQRSSQPQSTLL